MKILQKATLVLGLLIPSFCNLYGMQVAVKVLNDDPEEQVVQSPVDRVLLKEIDKAGLSLQLRNCLEGYEKNTIRTKDFTQILNDNNWLIDYVAYDGLTIGEYIITLCKKEHDRCKKEGKYLWYWLLDRPNYYYNNDTVQGPIALVEPFRLIIRLLKQHHNPAGAVEFLTTDSNVLNKLRLCCLSDGDLVHDGVPKLIEYMDQDLLRNNLSFNPAYVNSARTKLEQAVQRPTQEQAELVEKAQIALEFFMSFEGTPSDTDLALVLLRNNRWLARTYKAPQKKVMTGTPFYEELLLHDAVLPLQALVGRMPLSFGNPSVHSFAATLIAYGGSNGIGDAVVKGFPQEVQKLIRDREDNEDLFFDQWEKDTSIPKLKEVDEVAQIMELRKLATTNAWEFGQKIAGNDKAWLLDDEGPDGLTIGEYIVNEYRESIIDTIRKWRKNYRLAKPGEKEIEKQLRDSFKEVLKKCRPETLRLFKIDKRLFSFYDHSVCADHFKYKWGEFHHKQKDGSWERYNYSDLHGPRVSTWRLYDTYYHYGQQVDLGNLAIDEAVYAKGGPAAPPINVYKAAQRARAWTVYNFFDHIAVAGFEAALDMLRDDPWLAQSFLPDISNAGQWNRHRFKDEHDFYPYRLNPLGAIIRKFKSDCIIDDADTEDAKTLWALLLIHGADHQLNNNCYNLPQELADSEEVAEFRTLLQDFLKDKKAFSNTHNPAPEEDLDLEEPKEKEEKLDEEAQLLGVDDDEPVVLLSEPSVWKPTALKIAIAAFGAVLGRYWVKWRSAKAQQAEQKKSTAHDEAPQEEEAESKQKDAPSPAVSQEGEEDSMVID